MEIQVNRDFLEHQGLWVLKVILARVYVALRLN